MGQAWKPGPDEGRVSQLHPKWELAAQGGQQRALEHHAGVPAHRYPLLGHHSPGPLKTWHSRSPACDQSETLQCSGLPAFLFPRLRLFIVPSQYLPELSV